MKTLEMNQIENLNGGFCDESMITAGLMAVGVGVTFANPVIAMFGVASMWAGSYSC